ncbi:MAG: hypothetical protein GEV06_25915 [Luteitalea sp.]|nr:hypothetical protein [Luteitalea sp.]
MTRREQLRGTDVDRDAGEREYQAVMEKQPAHVACLCAERHSRSIERWAQEIINAVDSYNGSLAKWHRSSHPSPRHISPGGRRNGQVEMYDGGRYFTVTCIRSVRSARALLASQARSLARIKVGRRVVVM